MKRQKLLEHLNDNGCVLMREEIIVFTKTHLVVRDYLYRVTLLLMILHVGAFANN